eukprot:TRINITY_DN16526_c0_g1_i7.p5 TRINITY_DN16526_c0_g1~~TRINITY_DN16526_c0_g1_i7.p5  ORF type:complete len:224 (+),score=-24.73 TRINITY_DN16526_c0_g1_i7:1678-2349(+)
MYIHSQLSVCICIQQTSYKLPPYAFTHLLWILSQQKKHACTTINKSACTLYNLYNYYNFQQCCFIVLKQYIVQNIIIIILIYYYNYTIFEYLQKYNYYEYNNNIRQYENTLTMIYNSLQLIINQLQNNNIIIDLYSDTNIVRYSQVKKLIAQLLEIKQIIRKFKAHFLKHYMKNQSRKEICQQYARQTTKKSQHQQQVNLQIYCAVKINQIQQSTNKNILRNK